MIINFEKREQGHQAEQGRHEAQIKPVRDPQFEKNRHDIETQRGVNVRDISQGIDRQPEVRIGQLHAKTGKHASIADRQVVSKGIKKQRKQGQSNAQDDEDNFFSAHGKNCTILQQAPCSSFLREKRFAYQWNFSSRACAHQPAGLVCALLPPHSRGILDR